MTAFSGLEYIRIHQPALAFVDVRLPGMGGLEILQAAHAEGLSTLFIMISGHAEFAYAQKAMFHNAIGYCLKPFSRSELMDSMQKAYQLLQEQEQKAENQDASLEEQPNIFHPQHLVSSHKSVQMMIDYTEKHYQEDISIQNLAEYCSINPNYASQIFRQETGGTFVSYLTSLGLSMLHGFLHTVTKPYLPLPLRLATVTIFILQRCSKSKRMHTYRLSKGF